MKQTSKSNWLAIAGLLLALPTAYLISIAVLKYGFNIHGPFDSIQPTVERWGIKDPLGWNINLLILFAPVAGFLLAIFQVLKINWGVAREQFELRFTFQKNWFPILVAAFSISTLAILFFYMIDTV